MNKYWLDRELKNIAANIRKDKRTVAELRKLYKRAIDDITEDIEAFYGRYAKETGMTMEEAKKTIKSEDIRRYEAKAKRYVKERNFSPQANAEMRKYNVTMRMSRLELLKIDLELELAALASDEERIHYERYYQSAVDELKYQSGILGETINMNAKNIEKIIYTSFHNATWSDNIWSNQNALRTELDKLLHRGIIQGLNPRELARELRKTVESSVYNSERLLRTETARIQTDVFVYSAKEVGIDQYEWIAEPDACDVCKGLDGKVFNLKNVVIGENGVPKHPNCRCSQALYFNREEWERNN